MHVCHVAFLSSTGLLALAFGILNLALMIVAFDGFRRKSAVHIGLVVVLHLSAALVVRTNSFAVYISLQS